MPRPGRPRDPCFFLVTSHGRSATYWLAASLHRHPDVVCGHGPVLPPRFEYQTQPPDETALYAHTTYDAFMRKPLDTVFDELEGAATGRVYGLVHAYAAQHLLQPHLSQSRRSPVVVNLVRHPVTRIESLKRRILHERQFSPYAAERLHSEFEARVPADILAGVQERFEIDAAAADTRAFLYSTCFILQLDGADVATGIPSVPIERVTRDPDFFGWLFDHLAQGAAAADAAYLEQVAAMGPMNHLAEISTAVARFESWQPWMQCAVALAARKYNAEALYAPFGYDLSFVDRWGRENGLIYRFRAETPTLVLDGHRGFNVIHFEDRFYALAQSLGAVDLCATEADVVEKWTANGRCFVTPSLDDARRAIDAAAAPQR